MVPDEKPFLIIISESLIY